MTLILKREVSGKWTSLLFTSAAVYYFDNGVHIFKTIAVDIHSHLFILSCNRKVRCVFIDIFNGKRDRLDF